MTAACTVTMSASASRSSSEWRRVGDVRVARDHPHPEPFEAPADGPTDRPEPDDPERAAGELRAAEPLVRERAVAVRLAGTNVAIGARDAAG